MESTLYQPLGQFGPAGKTTGWPAWLIPVVLVLVGATSASAWVCLDLRGRTPSRPAPAVQAATPVLSPPTASVDSVAADQPAQTPAPAPAPARPAHPSVAALSSVDVEQQSGVKVVRPPGGTTAPGTFLAVPDADTVALPPAPDARLVEKGRYGLLPRRGPDGLRAAEAYARPVDGAHPVPAGAPRVALFVGGLGLNRTFTMEAAQSLPPAISFGFAPYGGDLAQQVAQARALGHEAVLQVPMESFDAGDGATMPHMLAVADSSRDTLDNLHWQMSRFTGYAGVSSFLGGKFTGNATVFEPVLKDIAGRGLFYFDDGTAARNLAGTLGPRMALPTVRADVVIDALADPEAVDAALDKLAALARTKGVAIGSTTGLPTMVDHLAAFTRDLASRGIALVPVSALALDGGTSAKP
jgi:uncharacterized protein